MIAAEIREQVFDLRLDQRFQDGGARRVHGSYFIDPAARLLNVE
jgi:hypothetical protein